MLSSHFLPQSGYLLEKPFLEMQAKNLHFNGITQRGNEFNYIMASAKSGLASCLFDLITFKPLFGVLDPFIFCGHHRSPLFCIPLMSELTSSFRFKHKLVWTDEAAITVHITPFFWPGGVSLHMRHYLT